MTAIAEFFAGLPFVVSAGIFLSGVALLYLVMRRTLIKRGNEKS